MFKRLDITEQDEPSDMGEKWTVWLETWEGEKLVKFDWINSFRTLEEAWEYKKKRRDLEITRG